MDEFLARIANIWRPHPGQHAFLRVRAPTKVLACGRRWGKTDACAVELLERFVAEPRTRALVVGPTLDQARLVFERFTELLEACRERFGLGPFRLKATPFPHLDLETRRAVARSAHRPRSLRGNEATHIVVDEAAFVPDRVVDEVLSPMMATTDGTMTLASTPNGFNGFWRRFQLGQRDGKRVWSLRAPSAENPHVRPEFLAAQRELVSERTFAVEYEAAFEATEGQIFPPCTLEAALVADLGEPRGDIYIGVDWGQHEDYTAVCVVQGDRRSAVLLESMRSRRLPQWQSQIDRVAALVSRYPSAAVRCDTTGTQDSLLERLREALPGHSVHGFDFGGGRKAGLIDRLASQFDRKAIRMRPDPVLLEELQSLTSRRTPSGNSRLEASSGHDDLVMALAMAVYDLPEAGGAGIYIGEERRFG